MFQSNTSIPYIEDNNFISTGFNTTNNTTTSIEEDKSTKNSAHSSIANTYESSINGLLHNLKNF
ncbi:hypothetical protein SAMN02745196_02308 [Clostridium collagenovorans DSM 3089]|uniref:Uncharacterized protein n=1 Tax=Clostridium collagenovorans DSM 3089 TaxID=1121306 RepID=A0A1M5XK41_9CLOT|nr:hypothetical protein [Clostridium collagenovorans]SHI00002.1 hypothetical protein SAMN02745196_02308 [Clostridium collagenovorans DSM 3089]